MPGEGWGGEVGTGEKHEGWQKWSVVLFWMVILWAPNRQTVFHHILNPPPFFKGRIQKELKGKRRVDRT